MGQVIPVEKERAGSGCSSTSSTQVKASRFDRQTGTIKVQVSVFPQIKMLTEAAGGADWVWSLLMRVSKLSACNENQQLGQ